MMKCEASLIDKIMEALPQLQCQKCKYDDCHSYATAIVRNNEDLNKCKPGLKQTEIQLNEILKGKEEIITNKIEKYKIATIDEDQCIGCTICIKFCPVDAIVGAKLQKHFIIEDQCNGCELCIDQCPVDCMKMINNRKNIFWHWPSKQSEDSKNNYYNRLKRLEVMGNEKKVVENKIKQEFLIEDYVEKAIKRENKKFTKIKEYE